MSYEAIEVEECRTDMTLWLKYIADDKTIENITSHPKFREWHGMMAVYGYELKIIPLKGPTRFGFYLAPNECYYYNYSTGRVSTSPSRK